MRANRCRPVVTAEVLDPELQADVIKLRQQVRKLGAVIGLLVALLRAFGYDWTNTVCQRAQAKLMSQLSENLRVFARPVLGGLHHDYRFIPPAAISPEGFCGGHSTAIMLFYQEHLRPG